MATYSLNIPNPEVPDWIAAFSEGWSTTTSELTQIQYAKREIQRTLNSIVKSYRIRVASQTVAEPEGTIE